MFKPGDVIEFRSEVAGKKKFHVCISIKGYYLFINSPKKKVYPTDFFFDCGEMDFVDPTPSGQSIISCSLPLYYTPGDLRRKSAKKIGVLSSKLFLKLIKYIENNKVLSDEEREHLLSGLADWF